eukprot:jgi/Astpho2/555/Aster-08214
MVVDKQPMDDSEVARETPEAQAAPSSSGSDAGKPAWLTPGPAARVDESEDPVMSMPQPLLPKHTVVKVIGNARTKQSLVGLTGRVKKAVGLGGWHHVLLENGEECRLQRNALVVLEHPTGNETDFSDDEQETNVTEQAELLPRVRVRRPPKMLDDSADGPMHTRRPGWRQSGIYQPRINFNKLDSTALKRYRHHYQLPELPSDVSKEDLADMVQKHFTTQSPPDENTCITMFMVAAWRAARQRSQRRE